MDKLRAILGTSLLLLVSVQVGAAIINVTNTNTEYAPGLFANLQGLEWLSLDETQNQSRDSLSAGYGGLLADGWRSSTRTETALLLGSLWDGVYSGYSSGNAAGAGSMQIDR
ncbi:MAG: hypothetical protein O7F15_11200 [Gammaproteobacteria bacterium]|nr:hypothetical protein [Gammaproteobacteria bacterium]